MLDEQELYDNLQDYQREQMLEEEHEYKMSSDIEYFTDYIINNVAIKDKNNPVYAIRMFSLVLNICDDYKWDFIEVMKIIEQKL